MSATLIVKMIKLLYTTAKYEKFFIQDDGRDGNDVYGIREGEGEGFRAR